MNRELFKRRAGILLVIAVFWAVTGAIGLVVYNEMGVRSPVQAANPCNPCNAKKSDNPCNPCSAKKSDNPCNPCNAKKSGAAGARLSLGSDFLAGRYEKATGLVPSLAHGNRLVMTSVFPPAAAQIYRDNAAKVRANRSQGMRTFPGGTVIVLESFSKKDGGNPGARGPSFVMTKEAAGYDPSGNDWRYDFARPDMQLVGEGFEGPVAFCKACHMSAKNRDFVFAVDQ